MRGSLRERLEYRLASVLGLQPPCRRKQWICQTCANARPSPRKLHTERSLKVEQDEERVSERLVAGWSHNSALKYAPEVVKVDSLSKSDVTKLVPRQERGERLQEGRWTASSTENASTAQARREAFQCELSPPTRISDLTDPSAWRITERKSLAPFRDFLASHDLRQTELHSRPQASDTYGIAAALRRKGQEHVISAVLKASDDPEFLRKMPKTMWTQILTIMSPQSYGLRLHRIHRSFNERQLKQSGYDFRARVDGYIKELGRIIGIRREHGISLDILDYRILLAHVAMVGNERAARGLWADMAEDEVQPDQFCYNRYIEALVWDENARLRLGRKARSTIPPIEHRFSNIALFKPGVSQEVVHLWNEMRVKNITGDTATYCALMTTLARDGRFDAAVDILWKIWHISVQQAMAGRQLPISEPVYPPGSPLFPTPRLLVTVAEVFGTVNHIPAGFRVLDYIARQYGIPLKQHVWYQLFRWTWLQARLKKRDEGMVEEGTPLETRVVNVLLDTMVAEPYQINPDMDLLHLSFQTALNSPWAWEVSFRPEIFVSLMEAGRRHYLELLETESHLHRQRIEFHENTSIWTSSTQSATYRLRHAADEALSKKNRYRFFLQRWTTRVIELPNRPLYPPLKRRITKNVAEWHLRGLPDFLQTWGSFAPSNFKYNICTGTIHLVFRSPREILANKLGKASAVRRTFIQKAQNSKHTDLREALTKRRGHKFQPMRNIRRGKLHWRPSTDVN